MQIKVYYGSGTDSGQTVYLAGKCRTDFGDVRFTDDDGSTLLDYWMEEKVDSNYAVFWVKVADDLSTVDATIYIYYGKSDETTTSNGTNTFLFFDDFDSSTGWTLLEGAVITNGYLQLAARNSPAYSCGYKAWTPVANYRFRFRLSTSTTNSYLRAQVRGVNAPTGNQNTRSVAENPHYRIGDYYYNPLSVVGFSTQGGVGSSPLLNPARNSNIHTIEVLKNGSTFKNYFDALEATATDSTTETGTYVAFNYQWAGNQPMYIYDVFIAKYVSPEPAHSTWGSEESPYYSKGLFESLKLPDIFGRKFECVPYLEILKSRDVLVRRPHLLLTRSLRLIETLEKRLSYLKEEMLPLQDILTAGVLLFLFREEPIKLVEDLTRIIAYILKQETLEALSLFTKRIYRGFEETYSLLEILSTRREKLLGQSMILSHTSAFKLTHILFETVQLLNETWGVFPILYHCTAFLLSGLNYAKTLYKRLKAFLVEVKEEE